MAELDGLFDGQQPAENDKPEGSVSGKEEWQIKREQARTEAFELLETATEKLSDPATLTSLLDVMSRFDRYSVSNAILITGQMPTASRLADFNFWKSHEVSIKKGERAVTILEPREYARPDGTKGVSYDPKRVFDISQTTAKKNPPQRKPVDEKKLVHALTKTSPVVMKIDNALPGGTNALFSPETKSISVRQGMTGEEIFRALSLEIAKARASMEGRPTDGFAVAAVAYVLCKRYDIPPVPLPETNPFEGKEPKETRAMLKDIRSEANNMSAVISKALETKNRDAR